MTDQAFAWASQVTTTYTEMVAEILALWYFVKPYKIYGLFRGAKDEMSREQCIDIQFTARKTQCFKLDVS